MAPRERWLGAVEGYYGPPLGREARLDLVRWLGANGFNAYAHAPKNDPYHRDRWRDPYPPDDAAHLAEVVAAGRTSGVDVVLVVSPGLDWRTGDDEALARKLQALAGLGATALGVAWDDVPAGGADLGAAHGAAVRAAVEAVPAARWVTCPTDYSATYATPYLRAFCEALPADVDVMWTGPGIVSPHVPEHAAANLAAELGRPLLFAENFPVNDGPMGGMLHLGPYPARPASLVEETRGVLLNFMSRPLASRVGLLAGAAFWTDPEGDREAAWEAAVARFPGLAPLARAARAWVDEPGPDSDLLGCGLAALEGDGRLQEYLEGGCRAGLASDLADEVAPWLEQWDTEAAAMLAAIDLWRAPDHEKPEKAQLVALLWGRARLSPYQLFGTRWAYYPVTDRAGDGLVPSANALVAGENLTDILCRAALTGERPAR